MNSKLIKLLTVLCVVLLAVLAGEWFYAKQVEKQTLASLKVGDEKVYKIAKMPTITLTQKSEQSYAEMVNRPLFIKGRRPVPEAPADAQQAVVAPSGPFNWQLSGVYTKNASLYALLSRTVKMPKGNFRKLTKGADIDGWVLMAIEKDKVILNQGAVQKELLLRKSKPKAPPLNRPEPETPKMAEPTPNQATSPNPVIPPDPAMGVDGQGIPEPEPVPEEQMIPDAEDQVIPEPEQDFQTDQFSEDTSTFESGTNEQF